MVRGFKNGAFPYRKSEEISVKKLGMDMTGDRADVTMHSYLTTGQVRKVLANADHTGYYSVVLDDRLNGTKTILQGSDDMQEAMRTAMLGVLASYRRDKHPTEAQLAELLQEDVLHVLGIMEIPTEMPPGESRVSSQSN